MAPTRVRASSFRVTAALSFCLVANLIPLMTLPAVLPQLSQAWNLNAGEAGWIGSIYFAGYAAAVLFLAGATDRIDGRWIVAACSLLGAAASLAFAFLEGEFWSALAVRFLGGAAFAGVHMPGLRLLSDRVEGRAQARSVATYTSSYAIGSAGSFLVSGVVESLFDWHAVFLAGAIGPALACAVVVRLSPPPQRRTPASDGPDLAAVPLLNPAFRAYVIAFAGNTWEVFAIRVWFVACLAWMQRLPGNAVDLPNLAVLAGFASLAGVPVSIAVAELASRWRRADVVMATCAISVATCLVLATTAGGNVYVVLGLLVLLQITSFADVGTLGAGAVAHADPARQGSSLAVYALAGFTTGFAGPAAVGCVIDWFGGVDSVRSWKAAFLTMAAGSAVAAAAIWTTRDAERRP